MENFVIHILWPFGIVRLFDFFLDFGRFQLRSFGVYFPHFGTLYQGKYGNLAFSFTLALFLDLSLTSWPI
jgi:hypothetical protein